MPATVDLPTDVSRGCASPMRRGNLREYRQQSAGDATLNNRPGSDLGPSPGRGHPGRGRRLQSPCGGVSECTPRGCILESRAAGPVLGRRSPHSFARLQVRECCPGPTRPSWCQGPTGTRWSTRSSGLMQGLQHGLDHETGRALRRGIVWHHLLSADELSRGGLVLRLAMHPGRLTASGYWEEGYRS